MHCSRGVRQRREGKGSHVQQETEEENACVKDHKNRWTKGWKPRNVSYERTEINLTKTYQMHQHSSSPKYSKLRNQEPGYSCKIRELHTNIIAISTVSGREVLTKKYNSHDEEWLSHLSKLSDKKIKNVNGRVSCSIQRR